MVMSLGTVPACAGRGSVREAAESAPPALDSLRAVVLDLIGRPSCGSAAQCRSAPFGAKPCGGPRAYVVYSTQVTDSARLAEALEAFRARDAAANEAAGAVSDCMVVTAPAVECREGVCVEAGRE
jgi:hypothetical protein